MKKFISMVMAAAMVVSLVPATAFAKGEVTATAKIVDAWERTKDFPGAVNGVDVPEVQMRITGVDYQKTTGDAPTKKVTLTLDNADFVGGEDGFLAGITVKDSDNETLMDGTGSVNGDNTTYYEYTAVSENAVRNALISHFFDGDDLPAYRSVPNSYLGQSENEGAGFTFAVTVGAGKANITAPVCTATAEENELAALDAYLTGFTATSADYSYSRTESKWVLADASKTGPMYVTTAELLAAEGITEFVDTWAESREDWADTAMDTLNTWLTAQGRTMAVRNDGTTENVPPVGGDREITFDITNWDADDNEVTVAFTGYFEKGDVITFDLVSVMDKISEGRKATVSVDAPDFGVEVDDLVYVSILGHGITASTKKVANVAEEEKTTLAKDLKIKSTVGDFATNQVFELKLSKGFEFSNVDDTAAVYTFGNPDGNVVYVRYDGGAVDGDEIVINADDIEIEATSAKAGDVATLTVKALKDKDLDNDRATVLGSFAATATVEVMKVVEYKVVLSVDEDEDVPVIYSGVDVDNFGITDDSDHWSLEVTAEETFPGAWSMRKGFSFELPEGVYVANVDVTDTDNFVTTKGEDKETADTQEWYDAFWNAYQEGDHVNFEFEKRVFDDVNVELEADPATVTFQLQLVADPGFEGDVVLKFVGDLVDEQEVTIAKFVAPYTVKAEQNDMIIDYRYTEVPTSIVITEAEAGLWAKDEAAFFFTVERGDMIQFEDDATFEVDKDSELEIDDETVSRDIRDDDGDVIVPAGTLAFAVDGESDEAATVTINGISLFMQRNIPAGPYDLTIDSTLAWAYEAQMLFAPDDAAGVNVVVSALAADAGKDAPDMDDVRLAVRDDKDNFVTDVCDYDDVVKEAWVNVVTAGRDQDDSSFTTKVVVPVGENKMYAGETEIALDVPAYINAAGYTMLPVRAVAVALGIDNNAVLWDAPTKTVTILFGQRIITMTAGQKVIYVNGSAIPACSAVEIKDGRTFVVLRDLATALGVTDVTWDGATKTATLNGGK